MLAQVAPAGLVMPTPAPLPVFSVPTHTVLCPMRRKSDAESSYVLAGHSVHALWLLVPEGV